MTKKHFFFFLLWKIKMYLKGFRKHTVVKVFSEDKNKFIIGYIQQLTGDSINKKAFGFDFHVRFLEPTQGFDSRGYMSGFYTEKDIKNKKLTKA